MIRVTTIRFRRADRRSPLVAALRRGRGGKLLIRWTSLRRFRPPCVAAQLRVGAKP